MRHFEIPPLGFYLPALAGENFRRGWSDEIEQSSAKDLLKSLTQDATFRKTVIAAKR